MIISDSIPRANGTSTVGRTRGQGGLGHTGLGVAETCFFSGPHHEEGSPLHVVSAKGRRPSLDRKQRVLKH